MSFSVSTTSTRLLESSFATSPSSTACAGGAASTEDWAFCCCAGTAKAVVALLELEVAKTCVVLEELWAGAFGYFSLMYLSGSAEIAAHFSSSFRSSATFHCSYRSDSVKAEDMSSEYRTNWLTASAPPSFAVVSRKRNSSGDKSLNNIVGAHA